MRLAYLAFGALLIGLFFFIPWEVISWAQFVLILLWALVGIKFDIVWSRKSEINDLFSESWPVRLVKRWSFLVLFLLLINPFVLFACKLWWFFPWVPWLSLAYRWITREALIALLVVGWVCATFPTVSIGRQFSILVGLLCTQHVLLLMAHHCMAGFSKYYLQDGCTQEDFLLQLYFSLVFGTLVFTCCHLIASRLTKGKTTLNQKTSPSQPRT